MVPVAGIRQVRARVNACLMPAEGIQL
jgi:hypothetical protein